MENIQCIQDIQKQRFYNYGNSTNYDESKTYRALRLKGQSLRKQIEKKRHERDISIAEYRGKFIGTLLHKYIDEANAEFDAFSNGIKKEFKALADSIYAEKKVQINATLSTAPTLEQINLLQALKLRGRLIGEAELRNITMQLSGNYQAMRTVVAIAEGAGYHITIPDCMDMDELLKDNEEVHSYLQEVVPLIDRPDRELGLKARDFYTAPNSLFWDSVIKQLDHNEYSAIPKIEKRELTETEGKLLNKLFTEKTGKDLENSVREAATSNELKTLIELSEYAAFLEKANNKK